MLGTQIGKVPVSVGNGSDRIETSTLLSTIATQPKFLTPRPEGRVMAALYQSSVALYQSSVALYQSSAALYSKSAVYYYTKHKTIAQPLTHI